MRFSVEKQDLDEFDWRFNSFSLCAIATRCIVLKRLRCVAVEVDLDEVCDFVELMYD